jgi:hypothetical protein
MSWPSPHVSPCVDGVDGDQIEIVAGYLWLFAASSEGGGVITERIQDALAASAFLAVDIWFGGTTIDRVNVYARPGADMQIPLISLTGVVLISVLLGIYVVYAGSVPVCRLDAALDEPARLVRHDAHRWLAARSVPFSADA